MIVHTSTASLPGHHQKTYVIRNNGTSACPLGYYCSNGVCQCLTAPPGVVSCSDDELYNYAVLDCYCATYDIDKKLLQVGACFFNCGNNTKLTVDLMYHKIPKNGYDLNETICRAYNRTGALCGRCLRGHYPTAYSFNFTCIECHHVVWNWFRYIMAAYLPLTLFFFIVLFFKVNVVSGYLFPVVYFGQLVSIPALSRNLLQTIQTRPDAFISSKVVLSIYGIWNLDFFKPFYSDFCLKIDILPTLALDYVIAVYPLLLMVMSYQLISLYDKNYRIVIIICKPVQLLFSLFQRNWDIRTSVIDAYATFFLLSFIKFLNVTFDFLVPTKVYSLHGDHYDYTWALYYAGDMEYFGKEHLPYGILAIAVMCVFIILPIVTLALYPFKFFQKFLNLFPFRWYILHTFMDSFQGCYKDGTEPGTHDCRWFSAVYLVFVFIMYIMYSIARSVIFFPLSALLFLLLSILLAVIQPYKHSASRLSKMNSVFVILFAMFLVACMGTDVAQIKAYDFIGVFFVVSILLGTIPLLSTVVLLCRSVFSGLIHMLSHYRRCEVLTPEVADCDRLINPEAYPATPVKRPGRLVNYSSI